MARGFNIFTLLRIEEDEDRTHTPVLADLLNPRGSHGQGFLFLLEFLRRCGQKPGFRSPPGPIEDSRWLVETQRFTRFGTIDLILSAPRLRFMIAIENKVYAGEQADQLKRYHRWLTKQQDLYPHRSLVLITPSGRQASSAKGIDYVPLSYREDIAGTLEAVLGEIPAERLRATVRQYLEIVQRLVAKEMQNERRIRIGDT
jgi:hypothetical protein